MYYLDIDNQVTNKENRKLERKALPIKRRNKYMAIRLKKQNYKCFWCATEISMIDHLDHIKPIYGGGMSYKSNLVASCKSCNVTKATDQLIITNQETIDYYKKLIKIDSTRGFHGGKYMGFHAYAFKEI